MKVLSENTIRNPFQAYLYQLDCQLATVSGLAMKKSRAKWDYERHISIAQKGLDNLEWFDNGKLQALEFGNATRVAKIIENFNGNVQLWADSFDVNK